jgi:hypothetical protein
MRVVTFLFYLQAYARHFDTDFAEARGRATVYADEFLYT